uniref:Uncharacterized protein n=1 Tax=Brassica campestris TaxID=3711 RepID=M4FIX1_BRACM
MAVDEQDNTSEFTPREAKLQRQIDGLQSQVTDLHKARETTENPELSSKVQSLNEKLGEHSKQLELSAEKLNQLQTENAATPASGAAGATREGIEDHQIHDLEESDSEPGPEKKNPRRRTREDGSRVFHNRLSGADVFQEVRRHAIHGGTSTRRVNNRGNSGTLCIVQTLHPKSFQRAYVDRFPWSPLITCKAAPARKIWSPQDPRPPPHIDKIARSFNSYQPAISQINEWGTNTLKKPPRERAPSWHQREIGDLRTHLLQWMNATTCFMEALKTCIDRRQCPRTSTP